MQKHKKLDYALKIVFLIFGSLMIIGLLVSFSDSIFSKEKEETDYYIDEDEPLLVDEKLNTFKSKNEIPQGISVTMLNEIAFTDFYILPISYSTYSTAKIIEKNINSQYSASYEFGNFVNVIFFDQDFNVINKALDFKGVILDLNYPMQSYDSLMNCIIYKIATEDSNNDSEIDREDYANLYISEIDGTNLRQLTHNAAVEEYYFMNKFETLFIKYRVIEPGIQEEHFRVKPSRYDVVNKKFHPMDDLDSMIQEIETIMIK